MISREEAKKVMQSDWRQFCCDEEVFDALLDDNQEQIAAINATRKRVDDYNKKIVAQIDSASESEFEMMVKTFKPYHE